MLFLFSAPFCALFFYLAYLLFKKKHYREGLLVGGVAVVLLVVTLGFVGLGYLWSTCPVDIAI